MTDEHPAFWDFYNRLGAVLWPAGKEHPDCRHDHGAATEILNTMPGIDIQGTLDWLHENGGHCDCEIMFNVAVGFEGEGDD